MKKTIEKATNKDKNIAKDKSVKAKEMIGKNKETRKDKEASKGKTTNGGQNNGQTVEEDKAKQNGARAFWLKVLYILLLSAATFIAFIGAQVMLGVLLQLVMPMEILQSTVGSATFEILCYILTALILIVLPPKIWRKLAPSTREKLGLMGLPTWTDLGLGPAGYVVSLIISAGLTALFSLMPWFNVDEAQQLGYSIYLQGFERGIAFIMLAVVAPIMEEIIFRGWFYGKLRVKVPKLVAIIVTSLLFGVVHMQWNVGISVFAMSLVMCTLREVTGTIYAGILVHIINNAVAFYLVFVANMV